MADNPVYPPAGNPYPYQQPPAGPPQGNYAPPPQPYAPPPPGAYVAPQQPYAPPPGNYMPPNQPGQPQPQYVPLEDAQPGPVIAQPGQVTVITHPVHWCAYLSISLVLMVLVILDAITYFAVPTWYQYCYFYIGPHTVWPGFDHWSEDTTVETLKHDVCRTSFDTDYSTTNRIADCIALYCPKVCHYFEHEITDAGNAQMPFSVLYIIFGCVAAFLILLKATYFRWNPVARPRRWYIKIIILFIFMFIWQVVAFSRFVNVGDFGNFKDTLDHVIPGCYFSDNSDDTSESDADTPDNASTAAGYNWAVALLVINGILLLFLFPCMLRNMARQQYNRT